LFTVSDGDTLRRPSGGSFKQRSFLVSSNNPGSRGIEVFVAGPFQAATAWTDAFLDPMRQVGDPLTDDAVATLFTDGGIQGVNALMLNLVANDEVLPDSLPAAIRDVLSTTEDLPAWADADKITIGEDVFWEWGPELVLILLCYSLPYCYAGRKGVQVLSLTSRLSGNATRRLVETAQMLVDVFRLGGLTSPEGRGRRTIQKVRLMHAAVRHLASDPKYWNPEWGVPINQEDLAGTLISFSWVALDGLRRLKIALTDEQEAAYLHCWQIIGWQLGVKEEMIPVDVESAAELSAAIGRRQFEASPEGQAMTLALVQAIQYQLPGTLLDAFPAMFITYFLGEETAAKIGIQDGELVGALAKPLSIFGTLLSDINRDAVIADSARKMSNLLINSAVFLKRGGDRPAFSIPDELKQKWGVNWLS
jgi:hypothetical protein